MNVDSSQRRIRSLYIGIHEWLPVGGRLRINLDLLHVNGNGPAVAYSPAFEYLPTSNHFQPFSTREFCLSIEIKSSCLRTPTMSSARDARVGRIDEISTW